MKLGTIVERATAEIMKYGFDAAAYEHETLRELMGKGWSFVGVEEGIFEAMTPNGVKIGPMTPDEIFWCEEGYRAASKS